MRYRFLKWFCIPAFAVAGHLSMAQMSAGADGTNTLFESSAAKPNELITRNDTITINQKAQRAVNGFMKLLNAISGTDVELAETSRIIKESYSVSASTIFYDSTVLIDDDLRNSNVNGSVKEKPVQSYLLDFDLLYNKSESPSVAFGNYKVSNIKKGDYLYLNVYYDCTFFNQSSISTNPYPLLHKVAELKVVKLGKKWKVWIINVHFLDSLDIVNADKNDAVVVDQPGGIDLTDSESPIQFNVQVAIHADSIERDRARKQNDSIRCYMAYRNAMDSANHAYRNRSYVEAYQFYSEAKTISNRSKDRALTDDREYLDRMIKIIAVEIDLSLRTPEEHYTIYIEQAARAVNQRNYSEALNYYNRADSIKPVEALKQQIRQLIARFGSLTRIQVKYNAGQYKAAIDEYDQAIKRDPDFADYFLWRGRCYEKVRDAKQAMKDYTKAILLDANYLEAYKVRGSLHEAQGSIAAALADFSFCIAINKNDVDMYRKIADVHVVLGDQPAALDGLSKGISNNPGSAVLHRRKGELLYTLNRKADACQSLSAAIGIDSTDALAYYYRGLCNVDLNKIPEAGHDFSKAKGRGLEILYLKRIEEIGNTFYQTATSFHDSDKTDSALTLLGQSITINPDKDAYHVKKGECLFKLHDYASAIRAYSSALQLNPQNAQAYTQRAMASLAVEAYRDAVTDFHVSVKLNPSVAGTYRYLGDAYLRLEDYNNAVISYDAALNMAKTTKKQLPGGFLGDLYLGKGEACFKAGNLTAAIESYNKALGYNKNAAVGYYNRGYAYLISNKLKNAEDDFRKALELSEVNPLLNFRLGEVYDQKGDFASAVKQYDHAIFLDREATLSVDPIYKRAQCHLRLQNYDKALRDYQAISANYAGNKYPYFDTELANVFLELNQPDSALIYLDKAITKNAADKPALVAKAIAYLKKGQTEEVIRWLETALASGNLSRSDIAKDRWFAALKSDKRLKKLLNKETR